MSKSVIIGFSKPNNFTLHGWLIEKIDGSQFDHAYLRFQLDGINRNVVCQSIDVGVQLVSEAQFATKSTPVEEYQLNITEAQFISMFQFCLDNTGKMYSLWGVIGEGIVRLVAKFGKTISNPFDSNEKTYFCSELVAQCLDNIDPSQFNLNANNISPDQLCSLLQQLKIQRIL
jgi:hypothetical protein